MPIKFPRTWHIPTSPGATSDDKSHADISVFEGKSVVITEKMDGENTTVYQDGTTHARSLTPNKHPSRAWLKQRIPTFAYLLPKGWRVCGEYLYAQHSIAYDTLPGYFLVFSVIDEKEICCAWDITRLWTLSLDLHTVPVLFRGIFTEEVVAELSKPAPSKYGKEREGFVIRPDHSFPMNQYSTLTGKYVRPHHVTTDEHWMRKTVVPNHIKSA